MKVLGIESSCDETGVAVYDTALSGVDALRAHAVYSQIALHAEYGGVVPELASRDHVRKTLPLIRQGIATGWMMTFIIAFRELVTASLIAPPNTLVVSTFIVREFEQGSVSVGMAMAVLCVLFSTTALLILNTVIDHRKVH